MQPSPSALLCPARRSCLIGIDSAPAAHTATAETLVVPLSDVLDFTSEFFVEWQVADHPSLAPMAPASEK